MPDKPLTVGDIRKAIEGLPDDARVFPVWTPGCEPSDSSPGVTIDGFETTEHAATSGVACLAVLVSLTGGDGTDDCCRHCGHVMDEDGSDGLCSDCADSAYGGGLDD